MHISTIKTNKKGKEKETKTRTTAKYIEYEKRKFYIGNKGTSLSAGIQWQRIWKMSVGQACEESVEKLHKESTAVFIRYQNQRGLLQTKYAMDHLLLVTSPKYAD